MSERREKLIFDNRSSRPLYESYEAAFDCYFQYWSEEQPNFSVICGDFKFFVHTNKVTITIQIYDNNNTER